MSEQAYDLIDRYLRNNLNDADYAEYSEALEAVWSRTPPATPDAGERETEIARVISSEIGDAIAAHEAGEGEAAVSKRGETVARWIMDRTHPTPPRAALPITDHAVHSQALWEEFFDKANGVLDGDKLLREVAALRATPPRAASPEPGAFTPQMAYEVWRDSERDEAEGETRWHMLAAEINIRLQNMNPPAAASPDPVAVDALVRKIAAEAYKHWDADRDSKVGKLLAALAGTTGIRLDLDGVRAAAPRADATAEVIDPSCTSCNGTGWWGAVEQYCQCADGRRAAAADATAGGVTDTVLIDWMQEQVNCMGVVWVLPCGDDMRFVQVRSFGDVENFPTVKGTVRDALAAALRAAQPTSGGDDA